uniref:Uncharacterized protein n=1 Tax=Arundo donax TaxID=35708 RepID=A0A0A9FU11_ARUDO
MPCSQFKVYHHRARKAPYINQFKHLVYVLIQFHIENKASCSQFLHHQATEQTKQSYIATALISLGKFNMSISSILMHAKNQVASALNSLNPKHNNKTALTPLISQICTIITPQIAYSTIPHHKHHKSAITCKAESMRGKKVGGKEVYQR